MDNAMESDIMLIFRAAIAMEAGLAEVKQFGIDTGTALGHAQAILAELSERFPEIANKINED